VSFIDHTVGEFFSAFDPSGVIKEQWAAVKQLGAQCLAQGHFDMQPMGTERGWKRVARGYVCHRRKNQTRRGDFHLQEERPRPTRRDPETRAMFASTLHDVIISPQKQLCDDDDIHILQNKSTGYVSYISLRKGDHMSFKPSGATSNENVSNFIT